MSPDEINSLIAVGGTLGGVVVGGLISGVLAHTAGPHNQSDQRDAQFTALGRASVGLVTEARHERSLNSTSNKLRQEHQSYRLATSKTAARRKQMA